tara:strand:- start:201 stop:788 length:588 start_codon:yes stop_codon:yes gene_type:complete
MKKVMIVIFCSYINSFSQIINYNNFDNDLIDSLVFLEINSYRSQSGNPKLVYSQNLHNGISKYITSILVRQQSAGHPDGKEALSAISKKVFSEVQSRFSNKVLAYEVDSYAEVSLKISKQPDKFITYQELAKYLVDLWKNSLGHNLIIQSWGSSGEDVVGIASGSVQIGNYDWRGVRYIGIYASFQISVNYFNRY